MNGLEPIEFLDGRNAPRRHELATGLDLVVGTFDAGDLARVRAGGSSLLAAGPGAPARYAAFAIGLDTSTDPTVVEALLGAERVSLLDDDSADHWRVHAGRAPDAVVPHPAMLAPRWFSHRLLEARRAFLRAVGAWPAEGRPLILQGGPNDLDAVGRLASHVEQPVVVLCDNPVDQEFAAATIAAVGGACRLPDSSGIEDRLAAIAGAAGVLAASPVFRDVARAFGVPNGPLADAPAGALTQPEPGAADARVDVLDTELDLLAALAPGSGQGSLAWSELEAAHRALEARGRRLVAERVAFADAMVAERARYHELLGQLAELQAGYDDIRELEVVRWRVALGDLRRRMFRKP